MKTLIFTFLMTSFFACEKQNQTDAAAANGKIKVYVCTRGCYQYLLETNGEVYFPDFVPDDLKKDGQLVTYTGEVTDSTTTVLKPAPNDVPIPDFEAKNIHIISMEAR